MKSGNKGGERGREGNYFSHSILFPDVIWKQEGNENDEERWKVPLELSIDPYGISSLYPSVYSSATITYYFTLSQSHQNTQILTQEDWNVVLFNGMERTNHAAALYFVVLMTFGTQLFFWLIVVVLVTHFIHLLQETMFYSTFWLPFWSRDFQLKKKFPRERKMKGMKEKVILMKRRGIWITSQNVHQSRVKGKMNRMQSKNLIIIKWQSETRKKRKHWTTMSVKESKIPASIRIISKLMYQQ